MKISAREYSRKQLERYTGHFHQLGGTVHYEFTEGAAKGVRAIDFKTASGLHFTVIPDRGLDIAYCTYKGINLVYLTPNGITAPPFYNPQGFEWLRIFFAGLLTTCGLTYFGNPGEDGDAQLGLHGRYSAIPAEKVCDRSRWEGNSYILEVTGTVEECVFFGDKLRLTRTIISEMGKKSLRIIDKVENFGSTTSPFTILYHINAGFPLLDESSELILTSKHIEPYDKLSEENVASHNRFIPPATGYAEQNFLHTMAQDDRGFAHAGIVNPSLVGGLGLSLRFRTDTLPYLSEWKQMGEGDYVVGMEPCNTIIENRAKLRKEGRLPFLEPGETREMELEMEVLEGKREIEDFRHTVERVVRLCK